MNLKERLEKMAGRFLSVINRFPISCVSSLLLSLVMIYAVVAEEFDGTVERLLLVLISAVFNSMLLEVASEYGFSKFRRLINALITLILAVIAYFAVNVWIKNDYFIMAYFGLCVIRFILLVALIYKYCDETKLLPWMMNSLIFSAISTSVVFAGLQICLFAFHSLIYRLSDPWKWALVLMILIEGFGLFNLFISYVPKAGEELTVSKAYGSIVHKAMFYVYALLLMILYGYILKIIFTWQLPVGVLNWFGSLTLLFYVFFQISLLEEQDKAQRWFSSYGGLAVIPVLLIQLYAIYIRVSAYGLTTLRYISLSLILMAVFFIINSVWKLKYYYVFLATAVVVAVITMTPLNVIDVPNRSQEKILKKALAQNNIYSNQTLDPEKYLALSPDEKEKIKGPVDYLRYSSGNKSQYVKEVLESNIIKVIYNNQNYDERFRFSYEMNSAANAVSIEGYRTLESQTAREVNNIAGYDCSQLIKSLIKDHYEGKGQPEKIEYIVDDNTKIVFVYLDVVYNKDMEILQSFYCDVFILRK